MKFQLAIFLLAVSRLLFAGEHPALDCGVVLRQESQLHYLGHFPWWNHRNETPRALRRVGRLEDVETWKAEALELFGPMALNIAFLWHGKWIGLDSALSLYEVAYRRELRSNSHLLALLLSFSENQGCLCTDSPSETDWSLIGSQLPVCRVALQRITETLKLQLAPEEQNRILESHASLHPGRLPFFAPKEILPHSELPTSVLPGSIEAFWMSNGFIIARRSHMVTRHLSMKLGQKLYAPPVAAMAFLHLMAYSDPETRQSFSLEEVLGAWLMRVQARYPAPKRQEYVFATLLALLDDLEDLDPLYGIDRVYPPRKNMLNLRPLRPWINALEDEEAFFTDAAQRHPHLRSRLRQLRGPRYTPRPSTEYSFDLAMLQERDPLALRPQQLYPNYWEVIRSFLPRNSTFSGEIGLSDSRAVFEFPPELLKDPTPVMQDLGLVHQAFLLLLAGYREVHFGIPEATAEFLLGSSSYGHLYIHRRTLQIYFSPTLGG